MSTRITAARVGIAVCCAMLAGAATALATENLPAFGKCTAKAGGIYTNGGCTKTPKTGAGKYEWEPLAAAVNFTQGKERATGNALLESAGGVAISCTEQAAKGEYGPGNQEKNVVGEFAGCEGGGIQCNSAGQPAGSVDTNKLHGEPGIIERQAKEEKNIDGVDLRAEEGEHVAEFSCGPLTVLVRGGVVAKWQADSSGGTTGEETNKMANKVELEFVAAGGKQVPEEWTPNGEGVSNAKHEEITEHLETSLAGGAFERSALSVVVIQSTSPKTAKVELRQCGQTIVC